jgi:hypothetical protein
MIFSLLKERLLVMDDDKQQKCPPPTGLCNLKMRITKEQLDALLNIYARRNHFHRRKRHLYDTLTRLKK